MPIDSLGFVYLFLPASMAAYYLTSNRYKNFVLLVVSPGVLWDAVPHHAAHGAGLAAV